MKLSKCLIPKVHYNNVYTVIDDVAYSKHGYYGCQLLSMERKKPDALKRRIIAADMCQNFSWKYELELFTCNRVGFRQYECTWTLPQRESYEEYRKRIEQMWKDLFT